MQPGHSYSVNSELGTNPKDIVTESKFYYRRETLITWTPSLPPPLPTVVTVCVHTTEHFN